MKIYAYSGKGSHDTNEDYIRNIQFDPQTSLHIVADGMGGFLYGEIASHIATEAIIQTISERYSETGIPDVILNAIEFANEQIKLKQTELQAKLGTTIAGVFIKENVAQLFWVGDVQIQHFRKNNLLFISENHSVVNEMKKNGTISSKETKRYKNLVTKSLSGNTLDDHIPVIAIKLHSEDRLCICSDGLYNSINPHSLVLKSDQELNVILKDLGEHNQDDFSIIKLTI